MRDTGLGIAADEHSRIFEMFTQVHTALQRSVTGLGIGLTLVKTLTQMHGGTVDVSSAGIGQGSEFIVRLPILVESGRHSFVLRGKARDVESALSRAFAESDTILSR